MGKIIKLTESDLVKIIRKVITEQTLLMEQSTPKDQAEADAFRVYLNKPAAEGGAGVKFNCTPYGTKAILVASPGRKFTGPCMKAAWAKYGAKFKESQNNQTKTDNQTINSGYSFNCIFFKGYGYKNGYGWKSTPASKYQKFIDDTKPLKILDVKDKCSTIFTPGEVLYKETKDGDDSKTAIVYPVKDGLQVIYLKNNQKYKENFYNDTFEDFTSDRIYDLAAGTFHP